MNLKASTLTEAIIAMVIIAIISGLALMTFISISSSNNSQLKILALYEIENIITQSHIEQIWDDEEFEIENILITRIVENYSNQRNLKSVSYKAITKQGKFLLERKELILIKKIQNSKIIDNNESHFD